MIVDIIENAHVYKGLNERVDKALEILATMTPEEFTEGRTDVDGDKLFLNRVMYETEPVDGAVFEAHKRYIDVMYMVDGCETIYVKAASKLTNITKPYDPSIDALLAAQDKDYTPVRLQSRMFCILFPDDAHMPGCICDAPMTVKKVIGKAQV